MSRACGAHFLQAAKAPGHAYGNHIRIARREHVHVAVAHIKALPGFQTQRGQHGPGPGGVGLERRAGSAAAYFGKGNLREIVADQSSGEVVGLVGQHGQGQAAPGQFRQGFGHAVIGMGALAHMPSVPGAGLVHQGGERLGRESLQRRRGQGAVYQTAEAVAHHPAVGRQGMRGIAVGGQNSIAGPTDVFKRVQQGAVQIKNKSLHIRSILLNKR